MSTFGTGTTTTGGSSIVLTAFSGTNGVQAGTDGLVPGPAIAQQGYLLGAGGDWTLEVKAVADPNDATERIATTRFVANYVANAQLGGNALLSALGDVNIANIADDQFLQYNVGNARWENATLTVGGISDVNLAGLQAGNTLVWDAVNSEWIPGQGGGGGAANLDDLGDVNLGVVANNHFLVNDGNGQFVNRLITTADLDDGTNIALLNAANVFTNTLTVSNNHLILSTVNADREFIINDGVHNLVNIGNDGPYIILRTGDSQKPQYGNNAFTVDVWDFTNNLRMWDANNQVSLNFSRGTGDLTLSGDITATDASLAGIEATSLTSTANSFPITFADAQASALVLKDANANEYMVFDTDNDQIINKVEAEFGLAPAAIVRVGGGYVRFSGGGGEIAFPDLDPLALTLKDSANNNFITIDTAQNQVNHHVKSVFTNGAGNTLTVQHNALTFGGGDGEIASSSKLNVVIKDNELVADGAAFSISDDGATNYISIFTDNADQKIVANVDLYEGANRVLNASNSIADLADVHTLAGIQAGNVLAWTANNRFEFTAPAQTYTDEMARNASGTALAIGGHTGISFVNDDANDRINATVSLGGFSVGDLSDVDTQGAVNGKILKYNNGSFVVADETDTNTQLSNEQVQDIVGPMFTANNAGNTGITFSYDDTEGVNDGTITATVSLSSSDLTDGGVNGNISLLDANQTLSGNKTFTGTVALGANATATTQNASDNSTSVATTAYVDAQIDADIVALNLGATYQGLNTNLTSISGLNIVDGSMIIGNNDNSFEIISIAQDVENFLGGTGSVGTLSDITLQAGATGDVLRVSAVDGNNIPTAFVNTKLASSDLSDGSNVVLDNAGSTFGAFTYDFRTNGSVVTVADPLQANHVATKDYVDNKFAQEGAAKLDDLDDVTIGAKADAQILVLNYTNDNDDTNDIFHNVSLSGDITITNAGVATIGADKVTTAKILDGNVTANKLANDAVTTVKILDGNVTEAKLANDAVTTAKILNANVTADKLANDAVTTAKILNANVTTAKIADANVTETKLANSAVTTLKIADANVTDAKLANDAVTTAKILNANVTADKLANDSVTTLKILDGNVTNAKLANSSLTVGSTAISLGGTSTTLSGMTEIDFVNQDTVIGGSITDDGAQNPTPTNLTLGGAGSKVIIAGDLQVSGTTTTVDTTNMEVKDRVISLNSGVAGANADDIGLFFDRGNLDPALFIWDESVDKFKVGTENGATASQAGEYTLSLKKMEVETPAEASDTTEVATTAWVRTHTSSLASSLDDLTDVGLGDVALADAHVLIYDNGNNEFRNKEITGDISLSNAGVASISSEVIVNADISPQASIAVSKLASSSVTVGSTAITLGNGSTTLSGMTSIDFTNANATIGASMTNDGGNPANPTVLTLGGVGSKVLIAGDLEITGDFEESVGSLSDVSLNGAQVNTANHFLVSDGNGGFVNQTISTTNLSNGSNVVLDNAGASFGAFAYDFTASTVTVKAPVADAHASTKKYVDDQVATKQDSNSTLDGISDLGVVGANNILYTTNNDTFSTASVTAFGLGILNQAADVNVQAYLSLTPGVDVQAYNARLADISALAPTADNFIVGDANNFVLKTPANAVASLGMGVAQHDLLIGDANANTFTTIATTASVRSFLASGSVGTLSDVSLVAGAVGDVLRVSSVDGNGVPDGFTSATLSYNDLSNTPTLGTSASKDAGTGADNVLLLNDANTLPALDGTNLTGLLKTSNNLQEIEDAGAVAQGEARDNIGLGNVATLDTTETGGVADAGKALVVDAQGKLGAIDGSNLTALGSIGLHSNVDLTNLVGGQGLVYNDQSGNFEAGTVPTTGTDVGESPTITTQSISLNPNALVGGDLVIYGRVMEVIDYGTDLADGNGNDLFDPATDFAIDFGSVTDTVLYCADDYGVLVV